MKLSVIIPVYNAAPFLERLINTINAFTFPDFECVFIENNSTDRSLEILREQLKKAHFRHSVTTEEKQGAGYARNTGIKMAKGDFLAFLDCDDIILPEKFEYDFGILEKHDIDFVFCRAKRIYEDDRIIDHPIAGIIESINLPPSLGLLWLQNFFLLQGTGSLLVKKSVVENLNGFHTSLTGEDAFLFIRMGLKYKGFFYNRTFFHYYRHKQSTVSKSNKDINGNLKRYFELRQNLFSNEIVRSNKLAMILLEEQLQTDLLKLHQSGNNIKNLLKSEKLQGLKLSYVLFNPLSLFINRRVSHIKYNPFFQIERKLHNKRNYKIQSV